MINCLLNKIEGFAIVCHTSGLIEALLHNKERVYKKERNYSLQAVAYKQLNRPDNQVSILIYPKNQPDLKKPTAL
jgi:hypothetical protein